MRRLNLNLNTNERLNELAMDMREIVDELNKPIFNRANAERIIRKHNLKNIKVAIMNSPFQPTYVKFENATNEMLKSNLEAIYTILNKEYIEIKNY